MMTTNHIQCRWFGFGTCSDCCCGWRCLLCRREEWKNAVRLFAVGLLITLICCLLISWFHKEFCQISQSSCYMWQPFLLLVMILMKVESLCMLLWFTYICNYVQEKNIIWNVYLFTLEKMFICWIPVNLLLVNSTGKLSVDWESSYIIKKIFRLLICLHLLDPLSLSLFVCGFFLKHILMVCKGSIMHGTSVKWIVFLHNIFHWFVRVKS